jgi:exopolysaccharide biosynthesis polyprenyl glycosylphosphotransferase
MFRRGGLRGVILLGDLALVVLALFIASWLRPQLSFGKPIPLENVWPGWPVYILAGLIWLVGFLLLDVYNLRKNLRLVDELVRLGASHAATCLAFAGFLYLSYRDFSRLQMLSFALISFLFLVAYHVIFRLLLYFFGDRRYGSRRVLIVGAGSVGQDIATMVLRHQWTGLRLVGFVDDSPDAGMPGYPRLGALEQTIQVVQEQRINEVIFALPRDAHIKLTNLVAELQALKVNVRVVPDFFDLVFLRSIVEEFGGTPLITLREPALDPFQRLIKRLFDLAISAVLFTIFLPVMAVVALAIKLDSPGPIIFKQQRVGENGRLFYIYKFRTMFHEADVKQGELNQKIVNGQPIYKFYDDPRVTRVGGWLRRLSLDELPQFINILKGEMSLVGPRPELPWLVERYDPWQRKRFEVPQGLTGWWQVNGRADKPMHLNTADDLYYIKNYSLWLDIQILVLTVKAVFSRRGSY